MAATITSSSLDDEHSRTLRYVFFAVGRSVFLYQQIELLLKTLLPYLKPTDGRASEDPFAEMKRLLDSRETMDPLVERLKKSSEVDHPEGFASYLEQVVKNRNDLIHSFAKLPFGDMSTTAYCREALAYLEARCRYAMPLMQLLRELLSSFVELLADSDVEYEEQRT